MMETSGFRAQLQGLLVFQEPLHHLLGEYARRCPDEVTLGM